MFPTLTRCRCDCCHQELVDETGLILVCDAVRAYDEAVADKHAADSAAWSDAYAASDAAVAAATGGMT
jgi:hypothetical protein